MKITLGEIKRLLVEATCPLCGDSNAYQGFNKFECGTKSCKSFSLSQVAKSTFKELTWNDVKREFHDAYLMFGEVLDGCDFGYGRPDRSEWDVFIDEQGILNASCERQPAASVEWDVSFNKWVRPDDA